MRVLRHGSPEGNETVSSIRGNSIGRLLGLQLDAIRCCQRFKFVLISRNLSGVQSCNCCHADAPTHTATVNSSCGTLQEIAAPFFSDRQNLATQMPTEI